MRWDRAQLEVDLLRLGGAKEAIHVAFPAEPRRAGGKPPDRAALTVPERGGYPEEIGSPRSRGGGSGCERERERLSGGVDPNPGAGQRGAVLRGPYGSTKGEDWTADRFRPRDGLERDRSFAPDQNHEGGQEE